MSTELSLYDKDKFDSAVKIAQTLAKSKIVPVAMQGKPEDVFAVLVMGAEIGIQPMTALNSINVIQGKPCISPQLMMALVRGRLPGSIIDIKQDESKQTVTVRAARSKDELAAGLYYEATWSMERAERMGLTLKDNYKKQAKTMLTWRAVAEACRMQFPDIILGLYAPEEFQDFDGQLLDKTVSKNELKTMMDEDFPIPEEEKIVGDLYRIQHGKFRTKQLKDLTVEEIAEYREELIKRKTRKEWENDLISVFSQYLNTIEGEVIV